jgi:hypothetical protein
VEDARDKLARLQAQHDTATIPAMRLRWAKQLPAAQKAVEDAEAHLAAAVARAGGP